MATPRDPLWPNGGRPLCSRCHEHPVYLAGLCGGCYAIKAEGGDEAIVHAPGEPTLIVLVEFAGDQHYMVTAAGLDKLGYPGLAGTMRERAKARISARSAANSSEPQPID